VFLAVVKANAYGHGLLEVARRIEPDVDFFGVHSAGEAETLLQAGIDRPLLIMGPVSPHQFRFLNPARVHLTITSRELLEYLRENGFSFPLHLKVETGTNRQGLPAEEVPEALKTIKRYGLPLVGLSTHFANIEDTTDHTYALMQLKRFKKLQTLVEGEFGRLPYTHCACSAAILLFPESYFSLVRAGISLYGYWPSKETKLSWIQIHGREEVALKPVLTWKTVVAQVKRVEKGEFVGYGCTYRTTRDTRIAVLPIGYYDGYDRKLSNRGMVLIRGQRAPVLGRVCMNLLMIDTTDLPAVEVGDIVTLIGRDGDEEVSADTLAEMAGTINYEILARLGAHVPKILVP
jgi:alanine racemase